MNQTYHPEVVENPLDELAKKNPKAEQNQDRELTRYEKICEGRKLKKQKEKNNNKLINKSIGEE